jgi:hypothetical protein
MAACHMLAQGAEADCPAYIAAEEQLAEQARAVNDGSMVLDATAEQLCLTGLSSDPCPPAAAFYRSECSAVIRIKSGTLGVRCEQDDNCASGACVGTTACNSVCVATGGQGQPCRTSWMCSAGLACRAGTCVSSPALGSTCDYANTCGTNLCASASHTCVAYPAVGATCPDGFCASGGWCDSSSSPAKCKATRASGSACTYDSQCQTGLTCYAGTCHALGTTGAPCQYGADCVSGLGCAGATHACQALPRVDAGVACADTAQCQYPQNCLGLFENPDGGTGSNGVCGTAVLGSACQYDVWCGTGLHCQKSGTALMGTCELPTVGSSCGTTENCATGDYCDSSTNTCKHQVGTGQTCGWAQGGSSCSSPRDRCVGTPSKCIAQGDLNEACSTAGCLTPLECVNNACQFIGGEGQLCDSFLKPCLLGPCLNPDGGFYDYSTQGACGAPRADGQPCDTNQACTSSYCARGLATPVCASVCGP